MCQISHLHQLRGRNKNSTIVYLRGYAIEALDAPVKSLAYRGDLRCEV